MSEEVKKMGRPTEHPKTALVKFRCDTKLNSQLEFCCIELSMTKSEVLRMSVQKLYHELKNTEERTEDYK